MATKAWIELPVIPNAGAVNSVTASAPLASTGGANPDISIQKSDSTHNGYLSSTDWTTFNNKFNLPSLTSGSVLFSNGTTIAQDNSNFFWDATNHRLGLGTNTPTCPLMIQITSDVMAQFAKISYLSDYMGVFINGQQNINQDSYNFLSSVQDLNLYINRPTGFDIWFSEGNSDAQFIIKTGGFVGIGTDVPASPLYVTTVVENVAGTTLDNSNTTGALNIGAQIQASGANANYALRIPVDLPPPGRSIPSANFAIYSDNQCQSTFSGSIGIKILNPAHALDVAGDIAANNVGSGFLVKEGANARMGAVTLSGGATTTVNNSSVTANTRIFLTSQVDGGTPGFLRVSSRTPGGNFIITSSTGALDTSTIAYILVEPT